MYNRTPFSISGVGKIGQIHARKKEDHSFIVLLYYVQKKPKKQKKKPPNGLKT